MPLFQKEAKCETILMNEFDLHESETACRTHFHIRRFAFWNRGIRDSKMAELNQSGRGESSLQLNSTKKIIAIFKRSVKIWTGQGTFVFFMHSNHGS